MEGNESIETFLQSRKDVEIAKISKEVEKLKFSVKEGISKIQENVKSLKNKNVDIMELCLAIFELYGKIDVIKKQRTGKCPTDTGKVEKIVKAIIGDYGAILKTSKLTNYIGHEVNQEEYSVIGPSSRSRSLTRRPSAQNSHSQNTGTTSYHQNNNYFFVQQPQISLVKKKRKPKRKVKDARRLFNNGIEAKDFYYLYDNSDTQEANATLLATEVATLQEIFNGNGLSVNPATLGELVHKNYTEKDKEKQWFLIITEQLKISKQSVIVCEILHRFISFSNDLCNIVLSPQEKLSALIKCLIDYSSRFGVKAFVALGLIKGLNALSTQTKIFLLPEMLKGLQSIGSLILSIFTAIVQNLPQTGNEYMEVVQLIEDSYIPTLNWIASFFNINFEVIHSNLTNNIQTTLNGKCPDFLLNIPSILGISVTTVFIIANLSKMAILPLLKNVLYLSCGDLEKKRKVSVEVILCDFFEKIGLKDSKLYEQYCKTGIPRVTTSGWAF